MSSLVLDPGSACKTNTLGKGSYNRRIIANDLRGVGTPKPCLLHLLKNFYSHLPFPVVDANMNHHREFKKTQCTVGSKTSVLNMQRKPRTLCSYLPPFLAVWKVTVSWEATGTETLPRIWMLWPLKRKQGHSYQTASAEWSKLG